MKATLTNWLEPVLIVFACTLTYAIQIPWLGFVADDWAYLDFYAFRGLEGLLTYTTLIDSRPFAFWMPWIGLQILGTAPVNWLVWTLLWNSLTTLTLWLILRRLFPEKPRQNLLIALLFAVYPLYFTHITSPLQLSVHAVCNFLIMVSFYLNIRAVQASGSWFRFTLGAVLASMLQLVTLEYFAGLELGRWLILYYLAAKSTRGFWRRLMLTLKQGLPYLLIWLFWLVWRLSLMPRPGVDRNTPVLLQQLAQSPLATLLKLGTTLLQDTVQMLGGIWARTYQYDRFALSPLSNWIAWGMALLVVVVIYLALRMFHKTPENETPFSWPVAAAGLVLVWLGFLPIWAIGVRLSYFTENADRFGMASMVGAALLLGAGSGLLLKNLRIQSLFMLVLIGLGTAAQFHILRDNRYSWEAQQNFYWQLKWRAPQLEAPTALIGNGQLIGNMGDWFLTPAIDHLYTVERPSINPLVYYFDAADTANPIFEKGTTSIRTLRYKRFFKAEQDQILVLQYNYGSKRCLWILSAADADNPYLEDFIRPYLKHSNLQQIREGSDLPADVQAFGSSYPIQWCYFFQKARLAEQMQDWVEVMLLWRQAEGAGFAPRNPAEYVPFILAAALTDQWEQALNLTEQANHPKEQMQRYLCRTWEAIEQKAGKTAQGNSAIATARANLGCQ